MIDLELENKVIENAFCIHILDENTVNIDTQIKELKDLVLTSGANYVGYILVKLRNITPATYIGKGKLDEINEILLKNKANIVIFDGFLSPSQTVNTSNILGVKVVDRTTLILDIFAKHAKTSEGKLQVELAQLEYMYPRLKGKGTELSKLGGGIGTRGPGETKLETDRRHIKARIDTLKENLKEIELRRQLNVKRRNKNKEILISLVGYTNVGKSTLLNTLSNSNVYCENKLFATLDTTTRKVVLNDKEVLISDTVGFIRNLPTTLINAFKSTLEAVKYSDINVIVASCDEDYEMQIDVTKKTLDEIGAKGKQIIVLNKCDKISSYEFLPKDAILIQAKNGVGIDKLIDKINEILNDDYVLVKLKVPYQDFSEFNKLKSYTEKCEFTYFDDYVLCDVTFKKIYAKKFSKFKK
ncbi:MAG: GTPase HflX [Clostridia bacterium]|nr:GTPase HflX [Clostridia bacterium]